MIFIKRKLFTHIICICLSIALVYLLGYEKRFDRAMLTYFSLIFLARFTLFRFFFGAIFVIASLYFPIGFYYGSPNVAVISAVSETDFDEVLEFFNQLPIYFYFIPITLVILFIYIFYKVKFPTVNNKYVIILFLLLCCYKPIKIFFKSQNPSIPTILVHNFKYPPFEFCVDLYSSYKLYTTEKQEQLKQIEKTNTIPIVSVNPKYRTYVIIIGESVRKDYMSAYGFKYDNTPFTNEHASLIWDGLIAPASNTQSSIPHLISQSTYSDNKEVNAQINNNIITIANDAGFDTYWLSNQGQLGRMEITVPRITAYSKNIFYTKKGEYNGRSSKGKYDTLLLPKLDNLLAEKNDKPKLIVMHLIGSHPHFCKRLQFDVQFDLDNKNISCYVSSIKETDDFIKSTIEILKRHNEDYSVVYFADHGLSHTEQYQDLRHNWENQNSYQVPLIFFDSAEDSQIKINKQISGYQFVYLLSHWMGIKLNIQHDYMQYHLMDIPEQKNIQIKDWNNKLFPFNDLKKDPNPY